MIRLGWRYGLIGLRILGLMLKPFIALPYTGDWGEIDNQNDLMIYERSRERPLRPISTWPQNVTS
jgi:hypothetical protein